MLQFLNHEGKADDVSGKHARSSTAEWRASRHY